MSCGVDQDLVRKLEEFRSHKETQTNSAAIVMMIETENQLVILDEEHEDISINDLKEVLPKHQPRFVVYSYKYQQDGGQVSYPLYFIFSIPQGSKPEQQEMYAASKTRLMQAAGLTTVFEVFDTADLTEGWLRERSSSFKFY